MPKAGFDRRSLLVFLTLGGMLALANGFPAAAIISPKAPNPASSCDLRLLNTAPNPEPAAPWDLTLETAAFPKNIGAFFRPEQVQLAAVKKASESVIAFFTKADGRLLASGFLVSAQGDVITNAHVLHNRACEDIAILRNGRIITFNAAQIAYRGDAMKEIAPDIAMLRIPELAGSPFLSVQPGGWEAGEQVFAIGHPDSFQRDGQRADIARGAFNKMVSTGVFSASWEIAPGIELIEGNVAARGGNSGGPVVNAAGNVVGVMTMSADPKQRQTSFTTPSEAVETALATPRNIR